MRSMCCHRRMQMAQLSMQVFNVLYKGTDILWATTSKHYHPTVAIKDFTLDYLQVSIESAVWPGCVLCCAAAFEKLQLSLSWDTFQCNMYNFGIQNSETSYMMEFADAESSFKQSFAAMALDWQQAVVNHLHHQLGRSSSSSSQVQTKLMQVHSHYNVSLPIITSLIFYLCLCASTIGSSADSDSL